MAKDQKSIDSAIIDLDELKRFLKKKSTLQVSSVDEKSLAKATALTWFSNYRQNLLSSVAEANLEKIDLKYREILLGVDRATTRKKYFALIKGLRTQLSELRSDALASSLKPKSQPGNSPPDFSKLVNDPKMPPILYGRWNECITCINADAPLSAVIMMGGLLEGLLLARVNKETDRTRIFSAANAPRDAKTGKPYKLKKWGLGNFLDVAHELGWITKSAKDVGDVLREYRNYIHPEKQLANNIVLKRQDATLFWELTKSLASQIVAS